MCVPLMGRKGAADSFWGVRNPQNSTGSPQMVSRGRGWGGRSKGEGDLDAEGGRRVAIGKSLWTRNQKAAHQHSRISISVYSAGNNKGWTKGGANCTQEGG